MEKDNLSRSFLGIIAFSVLVFALAYLSELLIPFTLAAIFSIIFKPFVNVLDKKKVPNVISLLAVIIILGFSFYLFGLILYSSAKPLISTLPSYKDKLTEVMESALAGISSLTETLDIHIEQIDIQTLAGATTNTAEILSDILKSFLGFLGNAGLVLLFMLFMLSGKGNLPAKINVAFNAEKASKINTSLQNMASQIRRYIGVKLIMNAITGLLTFLVLWLLGVDFPVFWGVLSFFVCFIPNIGAVIAILAPFILSLLQFDNFLIPVLVFVLLGLVYAIMGSIVEPKFMASSLNLNVLLILVALIFWGLVWGPMGMVLAIPLTTIIKIIFSNVHALKPISILMGEKIEV
jgi:predicted PurR-regulated permease PerM